MLNYLAKELEDLNKEGLLRKPRVISAINGAREKIDGSGMSLSAPMTIWAWPSIPMPRRR